jgi:hypothetical protein
MTLSAVSSKIKTRMGAMQVRREYIELSLSCKVAAPLITSLDKHLHQASIVDQNEENHIWSRWFGLGKKNWYGRRAVTY